MKTEKALFGAGCFWGVQYYFDQVPGVVKTTVGYCGGQTKNPSYEDVCSHSTGHAEVVLVEYDTQKVISGNSKADAMQGAGEAQTEPYVAYGEGALEPATQQRAASSGGVAGSAGQQDDAFRILLMHFFRMHDPTQLNRQGPDVGDQYRSVIYYFDDAQKELANKIKKQSQLNFGQPIVTEISPAPEFYPAEDYHQKYTEKTGLGMCHIPYEPILSK